MWINIAFKQNLYYFSTETTTVVPNIQCSLRPTSVSFAPCSLTAALFIPCGDLVAP
ncbi:hypothetical protein O23A_p2337 [Aeromonas salmonicida]|nr:hypothetical protein O23A_p2337 [Aeromonas salmonicida]